MSKFKKIGQLIAQNSDSSFGILHMNFTLREGRVKMMVVYSVCLDGQKRGRGEQVKNDFG